MEARMTHPVFLVPAALQALTAYSRAAEGLGVPAETLEMLGLRASQINGCSVCVQLHSTNLKKEGMSDERLYGVGAALEAMLTERWGGPLLSKAPELTTATEVRA